MRNIVCLILVLVSLLLVGSVSEVSAGTSGTYVTYYLPYLHTNTSGVIYCVVSNFGIGADNITHVNFNIMGNESGTTTRATAQLTTLGYFASRKTVMLTFSGQAIYIGTSTDNQYTGMSSILGVSESYGAKLSFVSTILAGTNALRNSHLNCKNIVMACFQGTSNPKRNLVGYSCEAGYARNSDDTTTFDPYNIKYYNFSDETTADNATGYSF
ncbi:hypothetical protein [Candidatus Magnetomonas plexicatena]|uniref:hypothetical protein n=1 Tax=Candidatus Magnetomonas plexicatena TaxID=2552947 RepID=UPI001103A0A9|nr:hypothetical protein E2O03_012460 [Nitrospirales bacterium LBB_01]